MPVNLRPLHECVVVKRLESDEEQLRGGIKLENVQWNDLGEARKVVITKDDTTAVTDSDDKARVEDAMHATKAAVEEGFIPGGGVAILRCIEAVQDLKGETHDIDVGIKIVHRALEEPTRQIVANAASIAGLMLTTEVLVSEIRDKEGGNGGGGMGGMY